ncbi:MAG: hypothetical protein AAFP26_05790 [Planctomycetota bacterium]
MLCQRCGEHEATFHETLIDTSGQRVETHLCMSCAHEAGLVDETGTPSALGAALGVPRPRSGGGPAACSHCGRTYESFRRSGLLGCPGCYALFEDRLGPLLERAHEGGMCHIGKLPARALREDPGLLGDVQIRESRVGLIERRLRAALTGERYEEAAKLKREVERLREMERGCDPPPGGAG